MSVGATVGTKVGTNVGLLAGAVAEAPVGIIAGTLAGPPAVVTRQVSMAAVAFIIATPLNSTSTLFSGTMAAVGFTIANGIKLPSNSMLSTLNI